MKDLRLWGILAIGLALRGMLFSAAIRDERRAFTPDSWDYWNLAGDLLFAGEYRSGEVNIQPEVFRTPGYPAFLTVGRNVPDRPGFLLGSWRASLAIQMLIDLHLVLVTFALGRELVGHGTGLLAALLYAISPLAVGASCRVLSDSLFAFLLTTAIWAVSVHFRTGQRRALLAAAGLMGLACYVRPIGLAMSAVFLAVLLFRPRRLRRAGAFAAVAAGLIAPWVVRNAVVAEYVGFSSFAGESLYWYSAAEVVAATDRSVPSAEAARQRFLRQEGWASFDPDLMGQSDAPCYLDSGALARYRARRARAILLAHPGSCLGIHLKGCLAFWLPGAADVLETAGFTSGGKGTLAVLHEKGLLAAARHYFGGNTTAMWLAAGMTLVLLFRYAGVLLCVVWRFTLRLPAAAWLCLGLVAASFLLPGPAAHPRFRVPVEPILSIAAAMGWAAILRRPKRREGHEDHQGLEAV